MKLPEYFPVTAHTDFVGPGSTFVVIKGMKEDGMHYAAQAIERGARTLVIQQDASIPITLEVLIQKYAVSVLRVPDCRLALAQMSARAAGYPAKKLRIIGVTGTKGKTTTAWLLEHILRTAGIKTALLSSVGNKICGHAFNTCLTTPQPDYVHQFFALCVQYDIAYVVMEVAAQALSLHRVAGIEFDVVVFTNFAQEHGEFYAGMQEYFAAKLSLLSQRKPGAPVYINGDDPALQHVATTYDHVHRFGMQQHNAWHVRIASFSSQGLHLTLIAHNKTISLQSSLLGTYNAYNITAAYAVSTFLGIDPVTVQQALNTFAGVPGRTEQYILPNGALCIIDKAHNPSSYEQILHLARSISAHVIVVCGAGGNRSIEKRPIMGALAASYADVIFFTTDNPRDEKPEDIIAMMMANIAQQDRHKIHVELDRQIAIQQAYAHATEHSVLLLLGKGDERYQIIGAVQQPFDERAILSTLQ